MKSLEKKSFQTILRLPEVLELTQLSRSTIYSLMGSNSFPQHISLGARAVAWVESEVIQWLNIRIADRDKNIDSTFNDEKS